MKNLRVLALVVFVMAVMGTMVMAAPEDYATVQWKEITYTDYSGQEQSMTITITGVVGNQLEDGFRADVAELDYTTLLSGSYFKQDENGTFSAIYTYDKGFELEKIYTREDLINGLKAIEVTLIPIVEGGQISLESVKNPEYVEMLFPGGYYFIDKEHTLLFKGEEQFGNYQTGQTMTFELREDAMDGINPTALDFPFKTIVVDGKEITYALITVSEEKAAELLAEMPVKKDDLAAVDEEIAEESDKEMPDSKMATYMASPTNTNFLVDGKELAFNAYMINDNNYMKLRDIAMSVNGSPKQFDTLWDSEKKAINMVSKTAYQIVGGELSIGDGASKEAVLTTSLILKDGVEVEMLAYNIDGYNYFKVRDVAKAFDIGVTWNNATKTAALDTSISYTE